ncbi:MAG: tRNA pseudouridine(38-40) synthase TruA [Spirochaetes bacterium]|nr:tRNA pseudouridine(38-40) synthase TruA [Spirochaetota bacterium]
MRIAALLQYDGTAFAGFQLQKGLDIRTVQNDVEKALGIIFAQEMKITAAGRTDAGVHAMGQVIHFDIPRDMNLQKLAISMNGILEKDVSVKNLFVVPDDFHSRYSACSREYRYIIHNHHLRSPFSLYRAMWVSLPLDVERMRESASYLIGEHDFASFCKTCSASEGTVREISRIDINKHDDLIFIDIEGNAFLHNQIRTIAGTLVSMEKNKSDPVLMKKILNQKTRLASGDTAPPYGLYFMNVKYNPPLENYPSAF